MQISDEWRPTIERLLTQEIDYLDSKIDRWERDQQAARLPNLWQAEINQAFCQRAAYEQFRQELSGVSEAA